MKRTSSILPACAVVAFAMGGCGESPPPQAVAPVTTSSAPVASPSPAPSAASSAAPAASSVPAQEPKKTEAMLRLEADRARWEEGNRNELARWTPALHAEAKALVDKAYPDTQSALRAILASKHRRPGSSDRDKARHPIETLEFFGFKQTMTTVEIAPGEGWFTEILAPALAAKGHLVVTTPDPNGSADERSTFYGQRLIAFLDHSPELYGRAQALVVDDKEPSLGAEGSADLVLSMRTLHGNVANGTLDAWLAAVHRVLKSKGVFGVEEHRARPDAVAQESAKKGYLPEKWVIGQIESAGFKLAGKSEINANPKDTKDYPDGVWTLPPTLRLGDQDRARYTAIGESDRMTLKFVRVDQPGK